MTIYGIVVEYNPLHYGHLYQIEEVRKQADFEALIVCMSGNFVQRGEPAIVDKWTRAEMALAAGADLVLELPIHGVLQAAHAFADKAVQILADAGVERLAFGIEAGKAEDFIEMAHWLESHTVTIEDYLTTSSMAQSYAAAYAEAIRALGGPETLVQGPNNQLGLQYCRAILSQGHSMQIMTIPRRQAAYHDQELTDHRIASATAIRRQLKSQKAGDLAHWLPTFAVDLLKNSRKVFPEDFWPFLRYQLISSQHEDLASIYLAKEGIENRLKENALRSESYEDFIAAVKTKRYSRTYLQRLLTCILLQISQEEMAWHFSHPYTRILAFSPKGQSLIKKRRDQRSLLWISNRTKDNEAYLSLDQRAGSIYRLAHPAIAKQEEGRFPIRKM